MPVRSVLLSVGQDTPLRRFQRRRYAVAAIMGTLFIVQTYTGLQLPWATPDTIATIIGLVTPALVWPIPNKKMA